MAGHAWEQFTLPCLTKGELLWSPCSTGPISVARQIVTVHDTFPLDHPEWFSKSFSFGFKSILLPLIRRAKRVIAVSEFTRQRILSLTGVEGDKVVAVHSGVGGQFRPQSSQCVRRAQHIAGLEGKRYFLSVSSLEPRKNIKRLLNAWRRVLGELPPDYCLVLAGKTGSTTVFESLHITDPPERVIMPGYIDDQDLPALYAGARALLYPSLAEGFGLPVLEAMACGLPVLTSNNSALPEIAEGVSLLVDPLDEEAIARNIRQLATDDSLCEGLARLGRQRAERFTWENAAGKTWAILEAELTGKS